MRFLSGVFITSCILCVTSFAAASDKPKLECFTGPVIEKVGGTKWQVTSCNDNKSFAFATIKGNPAMPFMFIRQFDGESYSIHGEGNGDKTFTKVAFDDLKTRSNEEFIMLIEKTKNAQILKREEKK